MQQVPDFTWDQALAAVSPRDESMVGVTKVRNLCDALGLAQLPLHPAEEAQVERLRDAARRNLEAVDAILKRAGHSDYLR